MLSLPTAFLVGLAHPIEHYDDVLIISLFSASATRRLRQAIIFVALYGLGMALINSILGGISGFIGEVLLEGYEFILRLTVGVITAMIGLVILFNIEYAHKIHHHIGYKHGKIPAKEINPKISALSIFSLGIARELVPYPLELIVLSWAVATGDIVRGVILLLAYSLGATSSLIPFALFATGLSSLVKREHYALWVSRISALSLVFFGLLLALFTFLGIEIH